MVLAQAGLTEQTEPGILNKGRMGVSIERVGLGPGKGGATKSCEGC